MRFVLACSFFILTTLDWKFDRNRLLFLNNIEAGTDILRTDIPLTR